MPLERNAKALEGVVPSGSLTGGAVAKVKRFAGHLQDILQSVTESRHHLGEVAGEAAQAIRDHLPAIIGITAGFLVAEAASMFLAAAPTGVSQAAAVVIQLALSAFGAAAMVEGVVEATKHGAAWLTTAWTAHGKPELIAEASKEFLRMLVAVAIAALGFLGAKRKAPKSEARDETRTEKAKHIPPRGDAFAEWFDSLSLAELDELLADESKGGLRGARRIIGENIRHPGEQHEWLMVAEIRQFKKWGVSMRTIQEGRTLTDATIGKSFRHGAKGAGTMHAELQAMVRSSQSYEEFLQKLNMWADHELFPVRSMRWPDRAPLGRYSLPDNLQLRGL